MGFVGLLQFSLECFDVLAWPLVALVYPLCASVRAIETNSNYYMRKLVTYWVLFSLISLFELAFVRVIEWLPFLPQIKLIFVCCLVIPRFDGAYYVYKSLVHPCLSVDRQSVVEWLNKPKDEVSVKPETFLAVAETYVQKNGTEALEKLIASKSKDSNSNLIVEEVKSVANAEEKEVATTIQFNEPNIVHKDVKTMEPKEKNEVATAAALKSCKEPNIAQKDVKAVEPPEQNATAATAKRTEKKVVAVVEVEEMTEPAARKEDKLPEPPEKNATAAAKWTDKKAVAAVEVKEMTEPAACKEDKLPEPPAPKKVQKEWTCAVCQVTTTCKANLNSHLQGQTHRATLDELKASKQAAKKSNSERFKQRNTNTSNAGTKLSKLWCSICDMRCSGKIHMATHLNGRKHLSQIKEMFDLCGGEQGWECGICNVKCSAESFMVDHLNGKKHLSRVEQMLNPVGGQPGFCSICNVRCSGEIDRAAHLNGGKHLYRIQEMINPLVVANKTAEQEVKVPVNSSNSEQFKQRNTNTSTCPGDIDMAAHLNGGKHLSLIQEMFHPVGGQSGWDYSGGSSGWDYGGGSSGWDYGGGSSGWDYGGGSSGWN